MRFYEACVRVAERIENRMPPEEQARFMETPYSELWQYHFTVGLWIRNYGLQNEPDLYPALRILGYNDTDAMSLYLLEFTQQYLKLKRAQLL